MPEQLIQFDSRKPLARVLVVFLVGLALVWSWFVVRWYLGNTMAEYLNPEQNSREMAQLAVNLAPNDPLTHWRLGDFTQKKLPADQLPLVVKEYEKAVSLAPRDYRFWMAFGTALEQSGEMERGEKALRRAVELAPAYSYPRWYLGNLLLRSGRYQEAFAELQQASQADPQLRGQLFNLAWQVYSKDPESLQNAAGGNAEVRAQFSLYLLRQQRLTEGLKLWDGLNESEKTANRLTGAAIIESLVATKQFHAAMDVWNELTVERLARASLAQFINGDFENNVRSGPASAFGWRVESTPQAQIGIDPHQGHNSAHSLRIVFQVNERLDALKVSQLVPVAADTKYDFECYVRTQELKSGATPAVAITNASDSAALATSEPLPPGSSDWQRVVLSFKTGSKAEAITVALTRATCEEGLVCPIFGSVWYDDFNLQSRK